MRLLTRPLLLAAAAFLPFAALHACTRHADVRDDVGQTQTFDDTPDMDADIPPLDVDLSNDMFATCAERPTGDCVGSNDFLCGFAPWAIDIAKNCQQETGCKTNGTIEITMGAEGCVTAIAMDEPNDDIVACVVAAVTAVKCPCVEQEKISHYYGIGNTGTCPE
jgi:hypothetical protein